MSIRSSMPKPTVLLVQLLGYCLSIAYLLGVGRDRKKPQPLVGLGLLLLMTKDYHLGSDKDKLSVNGIAEAVS